MVSILFPTWGDTDREFFVGLARAFAGALIFALPMLMTMEMWWLGFYTDPLRLALLLALTLPLLVGISHYGGFRKTTHIIEDWVDAFVAFFVAFFVAVVVLSLFGQLWWGMPLQDFVGKVALQTLPGGIGAMLARSQMGETSGNEDRKKQPPSYPGELFVMGVGALFLSLNVAPTEEMILTAYNMAAWQEILLVVLSLLIMHAFVYALKFEGAKHHATSASFLSVFARFTVAGYAIVLVASLYVLWTFGRTDGLSPSEIVSTCVVLAFPGAIGAAAARLVL